MLTRAHVCVCICGCACARARVCVCVRACARACMCVFVRVCARACVHTLHSQSSLSTRPEPSKRSGGGLFAPLGEWHARDMHVTCSGEFPLAIRRGRGGGVGGTAPPAILMTTKSAVIVGHVASAPAHALSECESVKGWGELTRSSFVRTYAAGVVVSCRPLLLFLLCRRWLVVQWLALACLIACLLVVVVLHALPIVKLVVVVVFCQSSLLLRFVCRGGVGGGGGYFWRW